MTHFEYQTPRKKLEVSPVQYPWTFIDQMYFGQIFKDEDFYLLVEQSLFEVTKIAQTLENIDTHEIELLKMSSMVGESFPKVGYRDSYEKVKEEVDKLVYILSHISKMVAWDMMWSLTRPNMSDIEVLPETSESKVYGEVFYDIVRSVEGSARKTIRFFIENHAVLGETTGEENDSSYIIDKDSEAMLLVKTIVRYALKEMLHIINFRTSSYYSAPKAGNPDTIIPSLVEIELGLLVREFDNEDDEEIYELVQARINHVLNLFGSTSVRWLKDFVRQMIKLTYGAKRTNFGLNKRIVTGTGATTGDKVFGKKIHRSSNSQKMLMGSNIGKQILQKKSEQSMLTERKRESKEYAEGGDVFILLDATGSTMPRSSYGLINFEEAFASMMCDTCRSSKRKVTVYFYNEGTTYMDSFNPSEPEKTYRMKKSNLFGNAGYRENDELKTFSEVFNEISKKPGARHSLIFISDGEMLTYNKSRTDEKRLRLMIENYPKIEVMPILISGSVDTTFHNVFEGYNYLHIKRLEDFDITKLDDCIKFLSRE